MSDSTASPDRSPEGNADPGDIPTAKQAIRRAMRDIRGSVTDPPARSAAIVGHLLAAPELRAARVVMVYEADPGEPDLGGLVEWCRERGVTVVVPDWDPADPRATPRVTPDRSPDVVVVPAMAVSPAGGRLGRGLGWYDRFLADVEALVVGVCWSEQVVDDLPTEPHDVALDAIVTESGWYPTGSARHSAS